MKRIAILLALSCLGLVTASLAVAKAPPGKGKPDGKGKKTTTASTSTDPEICHPKISVILKGAFVSGSGSSFTMNVTRANFHGHDLVGEPLTLMVDEKTSFKRNGPAKLSDFQAGDRMNVQARACKQKRTEQPANSQAAPPPMLAKRVTGHPAKGADSEAGSTPTTTTTSAP